MRLYLWYNLGTTAMSKEAVSCGLFPDRFVPAAGSWQLIAALPLMETTLIDLNRTNFGTQKRFHISY